ncbi:hypothetical protein [Nocardioides sp.]|uniref:hypothetical protein n=1 Tax=Nocardioides sp. TaxID=35761 RepID=UPI0035B23BEF
MTLRLDAGAADLVASGHEEAAATIDSAATSAPVSVDAGYGAGHVLDILAAVSETAGEIAMVNAAVGALVRDVASDLGLTEAAIGREFDEMARVGD